MSNKHCFEIGTEWVSGSTNQDGHIRRYSTFQEALNNLPDVIKEYITIPECIGVFIDVWVLDAGSTDEYTPLQDVLKVTFPERTNFPLNFLDWGEVIMGNHDYKYSETGYVEPVITDIDPDGSQTIIFKDGEEKKVCPECHVYVLRLVMVPDKVGKGLHEAHECPNCGEIEL